MFGPAPTCYPCAFGAVVQTPSRLNGLVELAMPRAPSAEAMVTTQLEGALDLTRVSHGFDWARLNVSIELDRGGGVAAVQQAGCLSDCDKLSM